MNSFSRYYRFHFGKLDCVANADACTDLGVTTFPTLLLYKNGEELKKNTGNSEMEKLSAFLEESLDVIRPGSRPKGGVDLPKVGAMGTGSAEAGERESEGKQAMNTLPVKPAKGAKTIAAQPRPTAKSVMPNVNGTSEELVLETYKERVTNTLDPWFIKFYAPWCHHCQAMAPNWAAMASQLKGRLNIGEVNCEAQRKLCKEAGVKSYPTMQLLRGPESIEYKGLRGVGDLLDYAEKATDAVSGVPDVDLAAFEKMEETEDVIFVYFYDHATTSEDFMALERLPLHLLGHGKLVKAKDPEMAKRYRISTWPRLMVSRDGKPTVYPKLMPQEMRNVPELIRWMQDNWLPLVPELTAGNSKQIMKGKFAVLGILSRDRSDEFAIAKREIKNAAVEWMEKREQAFQLERQELRDSKQLRIEEAEDRNDERALNDAKQIRVNMDHFHRKEVTFAWVDGVFWERWIRTTFGISVHDGEKVIMYDSDVRILCSSIRFSITDKLTEPSILGQHRNRQCHSPLTHIHRRNPAQSRLIAASTVAQDHWLQYLAPLLDTAPRRHQPSDRLRRRSYRCHRRLYRLETKIKQKKVVRAY